MACTDLRVKGGEFRVYEGADPDIAVVVEYIAAGYDAVFTVTYASAGGVVTVYREGDYRGRDGMPRNTLDGTI